MEILDFIKTRVRELSKYDDRQIVVAFLGALALTILCVGFLLPYTVFFGVSSSIVLFPLHLASIISGDTQLSHIWQAALMQYNPLIALISIVLLFVIWRSRILEAIVISNRNIKLVSGALLAFGLIIITDFFVSSMGMFPYGEQAQHLFFVTFALVFAMKAGKSWWRFLMWTILACAVLQSVYAVTLYYIGMDVFKSPGIGARASGTFPDPLTFYPIALMGIFLLLPMAISENRLPARVAYWLSTAVVGTALFLTFTRAAVMGLAAGLIWLAYEERRRRFVKLLAVLAVALMVVTMLARATTKEGNFGMDRSALGRVQIWRMSANIIRDNWLLGVGFSGYNGYREVQERYIDVKAGNFHFNNVDPLNQAITMTAFHGVPGAVVFLLLVYATWAACRSGRKEDFTPWEWRMRQGIKLAGIGILTAGLTDTPLYTYSRFSGTFMWLVCMGFLLHLEVKNNPPGGEWRYAKMFRRVSLLLAALAVLGAGSVITLGTLDARHASKSFDAKIDAVRAKPSFVSMDEIPMAMAECSIANEDYFFRSHKGYSLMDMHRALRVNVRAGRVKQGGSTITQQLAKNLFFSHDRTLRRKVAEIIMAVRLEKSLSKKELLETYLNIIDFAMPDSHGIHAAADRYFGKDASKLTDAECALLAGLIPSPPKKELTPEYAKSAIHLTLRRLANANPSMYISIQDELDQAGEDKWLSTHLASPNL